MTARFFKKTVGNFLATIVACSLVFSTGRCQEPSPRILEQNETWSGRVFLESDVTVPAGITLKIEEGTEFILKSGTEKIPQINVIGHLEFFEAAAPAPLPLVAVPDGTQTLVIKAKSYEFSKELETFRQFRFIYALFWAGLVATMSVLIATRL